MLLLKSPTNCRIQQNKADYAKEKRQNRQYDMDGLHLTEICRTALLREKLAEDKIPV